MRPLSGVTLAPLEEPREGLPLAVWAAVIAVAVAICGFSQLDSSYGDEGFHLLASQLIAQGKKPYIDFFYPQAPLYAILNAGWMRVFGIHWRVAHAFSALMTSAAVPLVASFAFTRWPAAEWRKTGAIAAAVFFGCNYHVVYFGTIGQAYGLCVFFTVAAFHLALKAALREQALYSFGAGLVAGAAAASSLLAAPVAPILLIWLARENQIGSRTRKAVAFLAGAPIAFLPLAWFMLQAPRQTFFNVFEYHTLYRRLGYWATTSVPLNDLRQLTRWLESGQAMLLIVLAGLGLLFLSQTEGWNPHRKAEWRLCVWLPAGLFLYLCTPRPTFAQYFILVTPFGSVLAALGVYFLSLKLVPNRRPAFAAIVLCGLFTLALVKSVDTEMTDEPRPWQQAEDVARLVNRVTPKDAPIYMDDNAIFFVAKRLPLPGLEHLDARKLQLTPDQASLLHIMPGSVANEWLAGGRFATVALWSEDERIKELQLAKVYPHQEQVDGYSVFWRGEQ